MAPWESKPAGKGGRGAARCRCSDRQHRNGVGWGVNRQTDKTQEGGESIEMKKKKKPLWVIRNHQKASESMEGGGTLKQAVTSDITAHRQ